MIFFPVDRLKYNNRFPWANTALIAINGLVFFAITIPFAKDYDELVQHWGFTPRNFEYVTMLTCMFLHGGISHILTNMLVLLIVGNNVERRLGTGLYLASYLATGIAGTLFFASFHWDSTVPLLGASGAVSGAIGMYMVFFPRWKVDFIYGVPFLWNGYVKVSSYLLIGIYMASQVLQWVLIKNSGIAFEAHIGGFFAGVGVALIFRKVGVRESFILRSEFEATTEEFMVSGKTGPMSTRLIYGLPRDATVDLIAKKHIPIAPDQIPDGIFLKPNQREALLAQCAATRGLYFRGLDAADGRRLADHLRNRHQIGMMVVPSSEFQELPPAVTPRDAWFGPGEAQFILPGGQLFLRLYSDFRLVCAGRIRSAPGESLNLIQIVGSNPFQRYVLNEKILKFDLARSYGSTGATLQSLAANAVDSEKIPFVNKSMMELAQGRMSEKTTFADLAEFDSYVLWVLNVATLVAKSS